MGSGFESQGAHFTGNPADSSESAGFLRFLNKCSFVVRGAYYPLCSCRGPVLAELGHPDVAAEDICTSACIGILGTLRSRRGCGRCAVVQYVRPVPSELVRGRLSRFGLLLGGWVFCVWGGEGCRGLVCYLAAERLGWCAVFSGSALRVSHGRSPQRSKEGRSVRVTGAPA